MTEQANFALQFLHELKKMGDEKTSCLFFDTIDSTSNELVRRLASDPLMDTVVVAEMQTKGRGRKGRNWLSEPQGNLYISLAIDVGEPSEQTTSFLPLAAGVAACDALAGFVNSMPKIKWPNDLLIDGKKIAGILCEIPWPRQKPGCAVVGLGVNIAQSSFAPDLEKTATSIARLKGISSISGLERPKIAARFVVGLRSLLKDVRAGKAPQLIDAWRARAEPFGRRVRIGDVEGTTSDIAPDGRLILENDQGEKIIISGGIVEFA